MESHRASTTTCQPCTYMSVDWLCLESYSFLNFLSGNFFCQNKWITTNPKTAYNEEALYKLGTTGVTVGHKSASEIIYKLGTTGVTVGHKSASEIILIMFSQIQGELETVRDVCICYF
jgi:hypothetical protein